MRANNKILEQHNYEGVIYISALELYYHLKPELKRQVSFKTWFKNLCEHGFEVDEDYYVTTYTEPKDGGGFHKHRDYYLTVTAAKEIATIHKGYLALEARNYLKTVAPESMDSLIDKVEAVYSAAFEDYIFTDKFRLSVENFIEQLGYDTVLENLKTACRVVPYNSSKVLKYFCGICWNQIKEH